MCIRDSRHPLALLWMGATKVLPTGYGRRTAGGQGSRWCLGKFPRCELSLPPGEDSNGDIPKSTTATSFAPSWLPTRSELDPKPFDHPTPKAFSAQARKTFFFAIFQPIDSEGFKNSRDKGFPSISPHSLFSRSPASWTERPSCSAGLCHQTLRTSLSHCRPTGAVSRLSLIHISEPTRPY